MPLNNRLKKYRAKINVNQTEMGVLVGVSRQTISKLNEVTILFRIKNSKDFQCKCGGYF